MDPSKTFLNPNYHVALVHFPIALLLVGTLIELFSFMWRRHGFRAAGRWMILLGALAGIPTALAGVYALNDVARMGQPPQQVPWKEVVSTLNDRQWHILKDHTWLESEATLVAVLVVVVWIACSDLWRRRLHLPLLALLLLATGLTLSGAWHGGEAVYRLGVAVQPHMEGNVVESVHGGPKPFTVPTTVPSTTEPTTSMAAATMAVAEKVAGATAAGGASGAGQEQPREQKRGVEYYVDPLQTHMIFAGTTVAIALAALSLSIRKITQGPPVTQVDHIAAALGGPSTLIGGEMDEPGSGVAHLPPQSGPDPIDIAAPRVPASRFWMLACLLGLLTAAGGLWVLASDSEFWKLNELWQLISDRSLNKDSFVTRRMAHVVAGVTIAVVPLILAALARWAPRRKILLTIFAVILLGAVAAQVWLGVLLLYDTPQGPVGKFN